MMYLKNVYRNIKKPSKTDIDRNRTNNKIEVKRFIGIPGSRSALDDVMSKPIGILSKHSPRERCIGSLVKTKNCGNQSTHI